MIIFK
ncbi:hypothetical protein EC900039_3451A, partial [Escherichia coli 90.0039]